MIYGLYLAYSKYDKLPHFTWNDPKIPKYPPECAIVLICHTMPDQYSTYHGASCPVRVLIKEVNRKKLDRKIDNLRKYFKDEEWLREGINPELCNLNF